MSGSDEQHDEQPQQPGPGDALRDAVERTFRDAAGALQRLTTPQGGDAATAEALAALTARVDALAARVEALEAKPAARPRAKKTPAKKKPAKTS